jgi:hypothetical protein
MSLMFAGYEKPSTRDDGSIRDSANILAGEGISVLPTLLSRELWLGTEYKVPSVPIGSEHILWNRQMPNELVSLYVDHLGELREYKALVVETLQTLAQKVIWLGPDESIPPLIVPYSCAVETTVNVLPPSLQRLYWPSQYFNSVQDELDRFVCETQIELRNALTSLDHLLGCVDHFLSTIRKFLFRSIRRFCSVCWEKRRWFLLHGARPPKIVVAVTTGLFAEACYGSILA